MSGNRTIHKLALALLILPLGAVAQSSSMSVPPGLTVGPAQTVSAPDRAAVLAQLQSAAGLLSVLHRPLSPYSVRIGFTAADAAGDRATGFLQQAWQSDKAWIWTAQLGELSMDRVANTHGIVSTQGRAAIPLREQMLRSAVFAPEGDGGVAAAAVLRRASAQWQGAALTCLLAGPAGFVAPGPERAPQEREFCLDTAGRLAVTSPVPGYFVGYTWTAADGPPAIAIWQAPGMVVLTAKIEAQGPLSGPLPMAWLEGGSGEGSDAKAAAAQSLAMQHRCPTCLTMTDTDSDLEKTFDASGPEILWRNLPAPASARRSSPALVIVHASLAPDGSVDDSETWGDNDSAPIAAAQSALAKNPFGKSNDQREVFLGVIFGGS